MAALDEVLISIPARAHELDKMTSLYIISAGARAKGLHAATVRETGRDNPHAVFVLLRARVDLVMVTMEVRRNPDYAYVIAKQFVPRDRRVAAAGSGRKEVAFKADPPAWRVLSRSSPR